MFISGDKQLTNNIGERNIQQTLEVLGKLGIKVLAADVGGNKGRTVIFDIEEGKVWVRSLGKQLYEL